MADSRWIELSGAANVRDLGGLPTSGGREVQPNRLIRSDNLQGLSPEDVRTLIDERQVRAVADLRTQVEVDAEGPGPLTREPLVTVAHFSLFPESGRTTDVAAQTPAGAPPVLPWRERDRDGQERRGVAAIYLGYLHDRADSVISALRLVAHTDGATVVHCAAGKDRTGVVTALTLAEVGVEPEAIVADYALSAERIEAIFARLLSSPTYADDLSGQSIDKHRPQPETMMRLLEALGSDFGGAGGWLRQHGWTERDAGALRDHLLG